MHYIISKQGKQNASPKQDGESKKMVTIEQKEAAKAAKAAFKASGLKVSVQSFSGKAEWVKASASGESCFSVADRLVMLEVIYPGQYTAEGRTQAGNVSDRIIAATPAEWMQFLAAKKEA